MAKQLNTLLLIAFALIMATNTATAQIVVGATVNDTLICPTTGAPLANVTVKLLKTVFGTVSTLAVVQTDLFGNYSIAVPGPIFSSLFQFIPILVQHSLEATLGPVHNCTAYPPSATIRANLGIVGFILSLLGPVLRLVATVFSVVI